MRELGSQAIRVVSSAVEVESCACYGQFVDLVGRSDPEVAHLAQDLLPGGGLEASEVVECPVAQPGPEWVGVDYTCDAGVVVVAGEDPVVGTPIGGLALSDQEDRTAGLCQDSGTGAPKHPPADDRDIDVSGGHRSTRGGDVQSAGAEARTSANMFHTRNTTAVVAASAPTRGPMLLRTSSVSSH